MVQESSKKSNKGVLAVFMAIITLSILVNVSVQVDMGMRVEKSIISKPISTTPQDGFEQKIVQDYSLRFNANGAAEAFIDKKWNKVDILINNAGSLINRPFANTTLEDFKNVYNTNVFGVAELTRRVIPFMGSSGHVVNISSMGGVQGSAKFAGLSAYSSSKGALITLTELLAEEYKVTGPSFNVLALGAVQTEMLEAAFPGYKAPMSAKDMAAYIFEFSKTGQQFYNGKLLQVSSSTP
jgi:NAD(P)-dependent dehydrogenase (short-subunit alcohol dehydrogenase family)